MVPLLVLQYLCKRFETEQWQRNLDNEKSCGGSRYCTSQNNRHFLAYIRIFEPASRQQKSIHHDVESIMHISRIHCSFFSFQLFKNGCREAHKHIFLKGKDLKVAFLFHVISCKKKVGTDNKIMIWTTSRLSRHVSIEQTNTH